MAGEGMPNSPGCITYEKLWEIPVPTGINNIAISGDGRFVSAGGDENLLYYDSDGNPVWEKGIGFVGSTGISDNGGRIVSGGATIDIFDGGGDSLFRNNCGYFIRSATISGDGDRVYYATDKEEIVIYNITDGQSGNIDAGYDLDSIAVPADGKYIAGGSSVGNLIFLNSDGDVLWTRQSYSEKPVIDLDITSKGDLMVYTADDTMNALFRTGNLLWKKMVPGVGGTAIDAEGSLIAVTHIDGITLFDRQGEELADISGLSALKNVDLSDDGRYLAFCSKDSFGLYSLSAADPAGDETTAGDQAGSNTVPDSGEVQKKETVAGTPGETGSSPRQSGVPCTGVFGVVLSVLVLGMMSCCRRG